jgi:CubicO group peptidase (beta-lactamase class C family)
MGYRVQGGPRSAAPLSWRLGMLAAVLVVVALVGRASASPVEGPAITPGNLSEFEGRYAYRDGLPLYMVVDGDGLVAIIDEAKYPLQAIGPDLFRNPSGDPIPFLRDDAHRVLAFKEGEETFARDTSAVPATARQLLHPRASRDPSGAYRYQPPAPLSDGLATASANPRTLPESTARQLVQGVLDNRFPDVHAILVQRGDHLLLEEYFYGYDRDRPHAMRSFTKSVIALLAGIAIDRGQMRADEPMLARLGVDVVLHPDRRKRDITLTDLLRHTSGLACDDHDRASPGNEVAIYEQQDWVQALVDLPMADSPERAAHYCSAGILAAGRMIERATGMPLPEFAQAQLFGPLGIERGAWTWKFGLRKDERNEFGQIHLRPRDMLKLGLLIRQHGQWHGRRVISAAWIDAVTARQSHIDDSDYGLGVWHRWYNVATPTGVQRVDTIMLSGNGGQKVYLVPALDLVAVFTGGAFNRESPVNAMMTEVLLPALLQSASDPHE